MITFAVIQAQVTSTDTFIFMISTRTPNSLCLHVPITKKGLKMIPGIYSEVVLYPLKVIFSVFFEFV